MYYANSQPSIRGPKITNSISTPAKETIQIGPIFKPWAESWKNRINPAPLIGIGESEDLRLLRELFFLAILCLLICTIILNLPSQTTIQVLNYIHF